MMKFEKLRNKRLEKGLTHADMASALGISKAYYCQIENRNRRLSYNMAFSISKLLGNRPDELFYEETKQSKSKDSE
jgi:transcriptional regulator with XRE-family HTH domain